MHPLPTHPRQGIFLTDMSKLPRKEDINVYDSLDERYAVKEFYGKTREQIFKELIDGYQHMQESLAFMGPVGFAYYAPAWERLFSHFEQLKDVEEVEEIVQWTKCIISIRCNSLDTETPEAIAALHRMLDCCEAFYHSEAYRQYCIEEARLYGYAESLIDSPPELQEERKECTRLRALLNT